MEWGDVQFASARSGAGKCNSPAPNRAILTGPTVTSFHQANSTGGSLVPSNWRQLGTAARSKIRRPPAWRCGISHSAEAAILLCLVGCAASLMRLPVAHNVPNAAQGLGVRVWQTAHRLPSSFRFTTAALSSSKLWRASSLKPDPPLCWSSSTTARATAARTSLEQWLARDDGSNRR